MFDIGWSELVVIGIVALIFIGPKELPSLLRTLGQMMTKVRSMASEFQGQFQEAMREAELDELRKQAEKLSSEVTAAASNPLEKATGELQSLLDAPEKSPAASSPPAETPVEMPASIAPAEANPSESSEKPAPGEGGRAA
jgi:sec-independent protein translocase protein TatB